VKGRWLPWSAEELEWIEERADWPRALLHRFFVMFFERSDVSVDALKALCLRKGWRTGRTGGFEPGHVPDNKGKKMPFNPGSARTQFKPGQTPANAKPLGHERVDAKDGYVYLLVAETNPHTGAGRRYVFKHRHLWEQVNGPVPAGHRLKSLDGNRQNTDPSNWIAIPHGMAPRLSGRWHVGYDAAPDELKPVILAVARLDHAARLRGGHRRPGGQPGRRHREAAHG
jgi:hypothetical protein